MSACPCVHFSSRLFYFPIDDFQRKHQLFTPTSCCSSKTLHFRLLRTVYYVHPTNKVTTGMNLRSERMLTRSGVEPFLAHCCKKPSGNVMEGTLGFGDAVTSYSWETSGQRRVGWYWERWWVDYLLRTVVIGVDENEHARKGFGKARQRREVPSSLKKIVSFCFSLLFCLWYVHWMYFFFFWTWYKIQILVVHGSTSHS